MSEEEADCVVQGGNWDPLIETCDTAEDECYPSCEPPLICYGGECMSEEEADCVSLGGTWNLLTQSCDTAEADCVAQGGVWDPLTET